LCFHFKGNVTLKLSTYHVFTFCGNVGIFGPPACTPWIRVFQKLLVLLLVKKLPAFYGTCFVEYSLILSPINAWVFQVFSFLSLYQIPVCCFPFPHMRHIPCLCHSLLFDYPNNIWCRVQIMKFLLKQFPHVSSYLLLLRPKYIFQHPILQNP